MKEVSATVLRPWNQKFTRLLFQRLPRPPRCRIVDSKPSVAAKGTGQKNLNILNHLARGGRAPSLPLRLPASLDHASLRQEKEENGGILNFRRVAVWRLLCFPTPFWFSPLDTRRPRWSAKIECTRFFVPRLASTERIPPFPFQPQIKDGSPISVEMQTEGEC